MLSLQLSIYIVFVLTTEQGLFDLFYRIKKYCYKKLINNNRWFLK